MSPAGAASAAFLGGVGDDWASRFSACCPAEYCTNPLGTDLIALLSEQGRNLLDAKETEFVLPPRRFILQANDPQSIDRYEEALPLPPCRDRVRVKETIQCDTDVRLQACAILGGAFAKQKTMKTCAVASVAFAISVSCGGRPAEEEVILERFMPPGLFANHIREHGMNLDECATLLNHLFLHCAGYSQTPNGLKRPKRAVATRPSSTPPSLLGPEKMLSVIRTVLRNGSPCIVNYDMSKLQQYGLGGHFSPVVAYNSTADRVLLLDTWPETSSVWIRTESLYNAIRTVDLGTGLYRGWLEITY
eukprot:GHVT01045244.1.p1 GENE.GHVT01045244.1~~GHVT01045244.1.p1  ORF type:complete len:304 (-),score=37.18 GHVT01045244.1:245-1156(-)